MKKGILIVLVCLQWCVLCAPLYAIDRADCDAYMVVETYSGKSTNIYPSDAFYLPAGLIVSNISIAQQPLYNAETLLIDGSHIRYVPDSAYVGEDSLVSVINTNQGMFMVFTRILVTSAPSTEGTEFWVGFMRNSDEAKDDYTRPLTKLCVTAATFEDVDVRLRNPLTHWDTVAHLTAGTVTNLTIPREQGYPDSCEIVEQKAIQVMSTNPITLYAVNYERYSFDASNVLPVQSLGCEHMLQTYRGRGDGPAEYAIVGVEDSTQVEVRPNTSSSMHGFDNDTSIILNRGEYIQVKSASSTPFTATYVSSVDDKPIAIFEGNRCANVPVGKIACDHLMEQSIPKYALGRDFVATATYGRPIDYILITAVYDSTEVYSRGVFHKTLMANETDTLTVGHWGMTNLYIHTSKNVVAFLYQCSQYEDGLSQGGRNTDGDPSMVLLIPLEQRSYHSLFTTFKHERVYMYQYCNVITPTATLDSMMLDGACIKEQFRPVVGLDTMSYARMSLTHGVHLLENSVGGFIAHVNGESQFETYAYTVGSQFKDLRDTIIYLQDTICDGEEYNFYGSILTQAGQYEEMKPETDTVYVLDLFVYPKPQECRDTALICEKDTFLWHLNKYTQQGDYIDTLLTDYGCDSVVHLHLNVVALQSVLLDTAICPGDAFLWGGQLIDNEGFYYDTIKSVLGCDSLHYTLEVGFLPRTLDTTSYASICDGEVYPWHGLILNNDTSVVDTLVNQYGCDSICFLHLTIKYPSTSDTTITICDTEIPYLWKNVQCAEEGNYTFDTLNVNGCDSTVNMHLNVLSSSYSDTTAYVCRHDLPYEWRGQHISQGTAQDVLQNSIGCDSVITLSLVILEPTGTDTFAARYQYEMPYSWRGQTLNQTGELTDVLTNAVGCDSTVTLHLTVYPNPVVSIEDIAICEGSAIDWHGQTISAPISYYDTLRAQAGYDLARYQLNVSYKYATDSITNAYICDGDSYNWHGHTYTTEITTTETLVNSVGCDSICTLNLKVKNNSSSETTAHVCEADIPYFWNGTTCTSEGDYSVHLTNSEGCDSVATLHLFVHKNVRIDTLVILCPDDLPYQWHGRAIPSIGVFEDHLTTAWGCDSTINCRVTYSIECRPGHPIDPTRPCDTAYSVIDTTILCSQVPFEWFGKTYSVSGEYHDTLRDASYYFCDSVGTLYLEVTPCDCDTMYSDTTASICRADLPYTWHGKILTEAGTLKDTLVNAVGCDSIVTLTLYVNQPTTSDTTAVACDSIVWHGITYTMSGDYDYQTTNAAGCDSTRTLHLTIHHASTGTNDTTVCRNDLPIVWEDSTWTDAGVKTKILTNAAGCDSVVTLTLSVNEPTAGDTAAVACTSFTWYGTTYTNSGSYTHLLTNAAGCDSTLTLQLTINQPTNGTKDTTICSDALPLLWEDSTWTAAGTKTKVLTNAVGCDSIVTLTLYVNQPTTSDTTAVACDSIVWHGITYTMSGDYDYQTTNAAGCDSTRTLHLTIRHASIGANDTTVCRNDLPLVWEDSTWTDAGVKTKILTNTAGCDSVVTLTLSVNEPTAGDTTATACTSFTWYGTTYTNSGSYTHLLTNAAGCDSTLTLQLTINQPTTGDTTAYVCAGTDFYWHGAIANDGAQMTLTNAAGCDSVVTLHLITRPVYHQDVNLTVCDKQMPYTWNGITCTQAGDYVLDSATIAGCDSVVTLHLSVDVFSASDTAAAICRADLPYTWHGKQLHDAGTLKDTMVNSVLCDSIITLTLTVNDPTASDTTATVCSSFTWHGTTYTASGDYDYQTTNANGCDSTRTLHLTINQPTTGDTTAYVCAGTDYYWHGTLANDGAQLTLTNAAGCDSVVTLHLITKPVSSSAKDTTVCAEALPLLWADSTWTEAGTKIAILTNASGCDSTITLTLHVNNHCCPDTIHNIAEVNICDTLLPYTWTAAHTLTIDQAGEYSDTLRNDDGCDSILYFLTLTTYTCCAPMEATMQVPDVCADDASMEVTVTMQRGAFNSYRVHYTNAPGNAMPFRDTVVNDAPADQSSPVTLTLPVPHDAADRTHYPRPDTYGIAMTLYDACGDSLHLASTTFDVLFPSWLLDQHWDDVIAILNDRYNGGYTFSDIRWLRDGEVIPGERELYIYLPHQLWTTPEEQHHDYAYQALLTRADDGKSILTCPMTPYHIDSTNVLTEPYVAVAPTIVSHENPVVHVMTNTQGTYWIYSLTGKLLRTADYEPCDHEVFDIRLFEAQTMYILVFTPRHETKPLKEKYRAVKVMVE